MKTTERFDRAISALVKGYLNDTLAKGNCVACVCGNIVAAATGSTITKLDGKLISTNPRIADWYWGDNEEYGRYDSAINLIQQTGYTPEQFFQIERAFEDNTLIYFRAYKVRTPEEVDADQYAGLVAVFNVLCEIEGMSDPAPYVALLDKSAALPA